MWAYARVDLSITTQAHAFAPAKSKMAAEGQEPETLLQALSRAPLVRVFDKSFNEVTISSLVIICDHSVHFIVFNSARSIIFFTILRYIVHSLMKFQ